MTTCKTYAQMTRSEREASRRKCFAAMATMKDRGWEHLHSIMDDCGTGGVFYAKGDRRFTLNISTIDDLPTD